MIAAQSLAMDEPKRKKPAVFVFEQRHVRALLQQWGNASRGAVGPQSLRVAGQIDGPIGEWTTEVDFVESTITAWLMTRKQDRKLRLEAIRCRYLTSPASSQTHADMFSAVARVKTSRQSFTAYADQTERFFADYLNSMGDKFNGYNFVRARLLLTMR